MKSCFLYVTNIPKTLKPASLIKDLDSKWAKATVLDSPRSEIVDALIYNPTSNCGLFDRGIEKLRLKEVDGGTPLKVFYVWFPPPNVVMTTLIPEHSILIPYLLVDSIPKEMDNIDVVGDLPFKSVDVKELDIPYKDDKWIVLRLPAFEDESCRNHVLSFIRNKKLSNGQYPRVTEIFVTEEPRLSSCMVLKSLQAIQSTNSYRSQLIFVYDLPPKTVSMNLSEALKKSDARSVKVFLIDAIDQLRLGFILMAKSVSGVKYDECFQSVQNSEFDVHSLGKLRLNVNEVWLQPANCDAPRIKKPSGSDRKTEFILTNYLHLHNLSLSVQPNDLLGKIPIKFRVNLYHIPDSNTQIGFITLTDNSESKVTKILEFLRSLVFDGMHVMVDEIWLKVYDLSEIADRRSVHVSRVTIRNRVRYNRAFEALDILESVNLFAAPSVTLVEEPQNCYNLIKSDLLFLINLPMNASDDEILHSIRVPCDGFGLMKKNNEKVAILYVRQQSDIKWLDIVSSICDSKMDGHCFSVKEAYLQCDETVELIQSKLPGFFLTSYVLVYNVGLEGDLDQGVDNLLQRKEVMQCCVIKTDNAGLCIIARLNENLTPQEIIDALHYIRMVRICGNIVCAELIWLANVGMNDGSSIS